MELTEHYDELRASIVARVFAGILDGVCLIVLMAILVNIARLLVAPEIPSTHAAGNAGQAVCTVIAHLLLQCYPMAVRSQTAGKWICNIVVVRKNTNRKATLLQVGWRSFMSPVFLLLILGWIALPIFLVNHFSLFKKRRRCLHDYIFRTDVLKGNAVSERFATMWKTRAPVKERAPSRAARAKVDAGRRLLGLDKYYRDFVEEQTSRFEERAAMKRVRLRKFRAYWYCMGIGISVIQIPFFAGLIEPPVAVRMVVLFPFAVFILGTICHGIFLLFSFMLTGGSQYRFDEEYKSFVAEHACAFLGLGYEPDARSLPQERFLNSELEEFKYNDEERTTIASGVSSLSGDLRFYACRCTCENKRADEEGNPSWYTSFHGLLLEIKAPLRIMGVTCISSGQAWNLPRLRVGNPVFDVRYHVYSSAADETTRLFSERFVSHLLWMHEELFPADTLSLVLQSDGLLVKVSRTLDQTTEFPLAPKDDHLRNLEDYAMKLSQLLDMVDNFSELFVEFRSPEQRL